MSEAARETTLGPAPAEGGNVRHAVRRLFVYIRRHPVYYLVWTTLTLGYSAGFLSIPILVGGHGRPSLRRAARLGAGWYGFALPPGATASILDDLDRALADAGRSRDGCCQILCAGTGGGGWVEQSRRRQSVQAVAVGRLIG